MLFRHYHNKTPTHNELECSGLFDSCNHQTSLLTLIFSSSFLSNTSALISSLSPTSFSHEPFFPVTQVSVNLKPPLLPGPSFSPPLTACLQVLLIGHGDFYSFAAVCVCVRPPCMLCHGHCPDCGC